MNGIETISALALLGVASAPHCAAMCGPLAIHACRGCSGPNRGDQRLAGSGESNPVYSGRAMAASRYTLGRTASYLFLGALAGAAGHALPESQWIQPLVALVVASVLLSRAIDTVRPLRWTGFRLNRRLPRLFSQVGDDAGLMGLATGFLPCGAILAALLIAGASTNAAVGAVGMAVFALASAPGTLIPVLAGARLEASWGRRLSQRSRSVLTATLLVLLAAWTAARPWLPHDHHHSHPTTPHAMPAGVGGHSHGSPT